MSCELCLAFLEVKEGGGRELFAGCEVCGLVSVFRRILGDEAGLNIEAVLL